jgi:hypothetical protein
MAAILKDEPYGTVLYDHRYSWQWRYYLFDSRVYVSWFHKPDSLVEDLMVFGRDNSLRFLAIHNSGIAAPIKRVVSQAGFDLLPIKPANNDSSVVHVSLFRIVPR